MTNAEKLMRVNNYLAEALIDADWRDMIEEYKTILLSREAAVREEQEKTTREYILREAARIVCGDRNAQYGEPEDSFRAIAEFWETYVREKCVTPGEDVCIRSEDVAMMMVLLKVARTFGGTKADTYIDIAGYAACAAEEEANNNGVL